VSGPLITLERWLESNYAETGRPTIGTARRWAKAGNIQPRPVKNGRSYYLTQNAVYTSGRSSLLGRLLRETEEQGKHGLAA